MPKVQNYPIYIPFKVTLEDAIALDAVAAAQQLTRSAVLRRLIRSLASVEPTTEIAKTAS